VGIRARGRRFTVEILANQIRPWMEEANWRTERPRRVKDDRAGDRFMRAWRGLPATQGIETPVSAPPEPPPARAANDRVRPRNAVTTGDLRNPQDHHETIRKNNFCAQGLRTAPCVNIASLVHSVSNILRPKFHPPSCRFLAYISPARAFLS
jgi:hypothetical protein